MGRRPPTVHGMVLIDKPAGMTSHDVVAQLRKRFKERRIGHAGTLDPRRWGRKCYKAAALRYVFVQDI